MRTNNLKKLILIPVALIFVLTCTCGCRQNIEKRTRILLVGIDGMSWKVMRPLIREGRLPNIKRLMDKGAFGGMAVLERFTSEIIWTTIATGKTSVKHGITGRLMDDPDSGELVPVTSNLRRTKAIWNILSENNKKVGMVHYLVTRPAEKINGVMISGGVPDINDKIYLSEDRSYPAFKDLCSKGEFERLQRFRGGIFAGIDKKDFPYFWWPAEKIDNFMVNLSRYLLRKEQFDFFCLYLRGIDITSHIFWKYSFPEGSDASDEDVRRYKEVIPDYYIWADKAIGEVLREAGTVDLVVIVSDHGFKASPPFYWFANVNSLLRACGLNEIKRAGRTVRLKDNTPDRNSFKKNVRINGTINDEEFDEIRQQAKRVLREIKVKETGGYLFSDVKDSKSGLVIEVQKPYRRLNPEHHVIIAGEEYKITDFFTKRPFPGDHSGPAVVILSGKDIKHNRAISGITIYDIAPTILYYMGLPVARDMDGKVISAAFKKEYLDKNPVRYIDTYDTDKTGEAQKPVRYSDEKDIKDMMRSLGYIN